MAEAKATDKLTLLGGLSAEEFLAEYWQKKPLLIRQALPDFTSPVSADELAGLALEESVESRIIEEQETQGPWQLRHGPFTEHDFSSLPEEKWTLLVQQLDAWSGEIEQLKSHFSFIPDWRIDDIMASYAPKGGSVGPHFDYYDVFLLQAEGQREWRIGQHCDQHTPTLDACDLSILQHFDTQETWILQPGDMLYLPPGVAHHGVAADDCITLSIGFRAPSHEQIISHFSDYLLDQLDEKRFYQDPDLCHQTPASQLSEEALDKVAAIIRSYTEDRGALNAWFGCYITETKNPHTLVEDTPIANFAELEQALEEGMTLCRNEASRLIFSYKPERETKLNFFADGAHFKLDPEHQPLIENLCQRGTAYSIKQLQTLQSPEMQQLMLDLISQGSYYLCNSLGE